MPISFLLLYIGYIPVPAGVGIKAEKAQALVHRLISLWKGLGGLTLCNNVGHGISPMLSSLNTIKKTLVLI